MTIKCTNLYPYNGTNLENRIIIRSKIKKRIGQINNLSKVICDFQIKIYKNTKSNILEIIWNSTWIVELLGIEGNASELQFVHLNKLRIKMVGSTK